MIQEIINFTNDLNNDLSNFLLDYIEPQQEGVYIIIDKQQDIKAEYYKEGNVINSNLKQCVKRLQYAWTIEYDKKPYYQKCFDLPNKRIHSISPFVIAFKRTYLDNGKENKNGKRIDKGYVLTYLKKAKQETLNDDEDFYIFYKFIEQEYDNIINTFIYEYEEKDKKIKDNFYVIVLYEVSDKIYQETFSNYLKTKLFNSAKKGITTIDGIELQEKDFNKHETIRGWSNFYNGYNADKPFLKHKTGFVETNRIMNIDAKLLYDFKEYYRRGVLPNPLPIFIDKEELKTDGIQNEIIRICNLEKKQSYREILESIFSKKSITLQKYYLLNIQYGVIVDFDFVPLFQFYINPRQIIENVCYAGYYKDKEFEPFHNDSIKTIFDFERIVVREIFNNSLVKIKDDKYSTNYFGDIDSTYVSGGDTMYQQIMKYRKAFYDFIYKSKQNAIDTIMFDDMMYNSILANIQNDEVNGKFEWNNTIKKKLNIWFSLYNLFNNNNKNEITMASKVTDLMSKMRSVAKGESNFETPEDFAFGAGQIVSYLIDRSAAANKTYAMLEPYLQKNKSNQLQDAIAQTIAIYKHDIKVYKGNFERLASQVLTDDSNVEMKPLLKYFLAGCFCPCVIYESDKKQEKNNN